jgi:diguanylate cyclase (GGDEF)-like protein
MKILITDDDRSSRLILKSYLVRNGHIVVEATNGKEAIETFDRENPDLIMMDVTMPVMTGYEATTIIKQKCGNRFVPIIFLTGMSDDDSLAKCVTSGGDDFLNKPLNGVLLGAKVEAMQRILKMHQDLTAANQKLNELSIRDALTGLYNRRYMDKQADLLWAEASQQQQSFAMLMIDIDNFKKYNDHYGHQSGDDCLRKVAMAINEAVLTIRSQGIAKDAFVARYGGEEFTVIIPNVSKQALELIAKVMVTGVHNLDIPHEVNENWGVVTISVGGEWLDKATDKIVKLFRTSDARLYQAKKNGRNRAEL